MRVSIVSVLLAGSLLALGACSTLGQPSNLTLAELTERCESRGGHLNPTGQQTGEARRDHRCTGARVPIVGNGQARSTTNRAIDRALVGRRPTT